MKKLISTPKIQLALLLIFILGTALWGLRVSLVFPFVCVLSCLTFDFVFIKIRKLPNLQLTAALVSGLIIALLYAPNRPLFEVIIACLIAMASKNFLRFSNRHIFNPAGFGVFLAAVIFRQTVSWWGVSWQQLIPLGLSSLFFIILLSPLLVSIYRMKRHWTVISFLAIYLLLSKISSTFSLYNIFDPTVFFFTAVMLPEPMTTPVRKNLQIMFGAFVALFVIIISLPIFSFVPDPLITALLLSNAVFFRLK